MSSLASQCFDLAEEREANMDKLLALSLEDKVTYSKMIIQRFYIKQRGKVYVSYSGGKDSTVLLDLVRSLYPEVPAVFFDTGLEFPEIRDQARETENVVFVRPKMSFKKVIETYGYPVIGKNAAHWIHLAQNGAPSGLKQMEADTKFGYKKFNYMVDAPFKVSENCCDVMKKRPARDYYKETGRAPIIGTRIDESNNREETWKKEGENREGKIPQSNPLSIWTEQNIWDYIRSRGLKYSKAYDMGYDRTGCVFCMFGVMSDRDRFLKLKATHPKLWEYCMRERERGGLGMKEVLEYMGIPTGCEQANLFDYIEGD